MCLAVFILDTILYPGKEKISCHPGLGWKQNQKGNFFFLGMCMKARLIIHQNYRAQTALC